MNTTKIKKWLWPAVLLGIAACASVAVKMGDLEVTITPLGETAKMPPGGVPKGQFTDPATGKTYKLFDMNGDGGPDFAEDADGRLYRITPAHSSVAGLTIGLRQTSGWAFNGKPDVVGKYIYPTVTFYNNEPDMLYPFTFDQPASQYLADYGLDQLLAGQPATLASGLDINAFSWDGGSSFDLDVTVHWASALGWPDILEHQGLQYQFAGLSDTPGAIPEYLVLRTVGSWIDVVRWLSEFGYESLSFLQVEDEDGNVIGDIFIQIDEVNNVVFVYLDGQLFLSEPLW